MLEFTYNNGYHASLKMSPFEALYGRKCRTPVRWDNPVNRIIIGPEMIKDIEEQVAKIR